MPRRIVALTAPLLFFSSLGSRTARADTGFSSPESYARQERAREKSSSGRTLTIMGIVHLAVGGALIASAAIQGERCSQTPGCSSEMGGIPEIVSGSLLFSSGAIFATAGIPMWAIGHRDAGRSAPITLTPSATALTIHF